MSIPLLPKLKSLPLSLPIEGAVRIELEEGIPVFRASSTVRRKYAYHFQRLQMAIFSRLLMVGLFPPCCTSAVQNRIEELLEKQQDASLNAEEEQELDCYEEIDDYLSFVNRTIRNLSLTQIQQAS